MKAEETPCPRLDFLCLFTASVFLTDASFVKKLTPSQFSRADSFCLSASSFFFLKDVRKIVALQV